MTVFWWIAAFYSIFIWAVRVPKNLQISDHHLGDAAETS